MTDVALDPLDDTRVHPFSYADAIDLCADITGADCALPARLTIPALIGTRDVVNIILTLNTPASRPNYSGVTHHPDALNLTLMQVLQNFHLNLRQQLSRAGTYSNCFASLDQLWRHIAAIDP